MINFNYLSSREKWVIYDTSAMLDDWYCPECGCQTDKPRRAPPFSRASICCGDCDCELTIRTGGGQGDPFDWHYGKPPSEEDAAKFDKLISELKELERGQHDWRDYRSEAKGKWVARIAGEAREFIEQLTGKDG